MAARIELDAARIDHGERAIEPLGIEVNAVTRDARHVVDNRDALPPDLIEKRRLADIRATNDRDDWLAHKIPSL